MNGPVLPKKPLLGLILERENILTQSQVLGILGEQKRQRDLGKPVAFGHVALEMKLLTPAQLQRALQLQAKLAVPPGERKPLGYYLLEAGLVSPTQLLKCLEEQKVRGGRIGEILIGHGWLAEGMLDMFLKMQAADMQART